MSTTNVPTPSGDQRPELVSTPAWQQDAAALATTRQIVRACMRCRKQKSKCDPFRPCSVCVKAGVECVSRPVNETKEDGIETHRARSMPRPPRASEERPSKVRRVANDSARPSRDQEPTRPRRSENRTSQRSTSAEAQSGTPVDDANGDEEVSHVDVGDSNMNTKLFTLTPGHLMENSPSPYEQHQSLNCANSNNSPAARINFIGDQDTLSMSSPSASTIIDPQHRAVLPWSYSRVSAAALLSHLPPRPVTDYLIAVYFNTVHWFMVVVHEGHFLRHYREMLDLFARDPKLVPNTDEDFTFALLILTMVVLGGRYTSVHSVRSQRCKQIHLDFCQSMRSHYPVLDGQDFDVVENTSRIFSVVRGNSTDNLACGTLATIQSHLLLGSLFLYHGEANLAWANSGSTIRAAQALSLHKENSELRWSSSYYRTMEPSERCQLRRRLFWGVHTSDRFLAMCYGLPFLISDDDCVAGAPCEDNIYPTPGCSSFLMLEDDLEGPDATGGAVTLLTYQTYKLHIYIILGQIISGLYRQSNGESNSLLSAFNSPTKSFAPSRGAQKSEELLETVERLDAKLRNWYNHLPQALRLSADMSYPPYDQDCGKGGDDVDDDVTVIPAQDDPLKDSVKVQNRRCKVRRGIYGMQALLLQLAYDNALVLIHRPVLALKNNTSSIVSHEVFRRSVDACWNAALRMSNIGKHHILHRNQHAHAISYVGIHLFTAGVVLSVFGSSDPLSRRAWEAKQGLSRIIRMQRQLRKKVVVSGQSLAILENLAREVVRKEMAIILATDIDGAEENKTSMPPPPKETPVGAQAQPAIAWHMPNVDAQRPLATPAMNNAIVSPTNLLTTSSMGVHSDLVLENDMFNESVLDIERFLAESQFLPGLDPGMPSHDASFLGNGAGGGSQPSEIWWFSQEG
ncbi:hypothetical protein MKZ38_008852 [Zalerion maritima]|uniref:Zn(2)-C6 fungal-type domain-containing protein n=1 Tax=Zalerion maritima TaxID=339359 RepID=A0AAD5RH82_9PEZI|nr:hypothetical protein MKZ38_008852 [Zalerion maritima]